MIFPEFDSCIAGKAGFMPDCGVISVYYNSWYSIIYNSSAAPNSTLT
jgi:hypothetical protein